MKCFKLIKVKLFHVNRVVVRPAGICPPRGVLGVLQVDIVLAESAHLLLSPSPRIIDLSLQSFRFLHSSPPQLRLACHSPHFWSRTNQAGEETRPTAIHAWRVLAMYARGWTEARQNWILFPEALRCADGKPICCAVRDPWSSSVFCVIDQQEWLSVSRGNYVAINRFGLILVY